MSRNFLIKKILIVSSILMIITFGGIILWKKSRNKNTALSQEEGFEIRKRSQLLSRSANSFSRFKIDIYVHKNKIDDIKKKLNAVESLNLRILETKNTSKVKLSIDGTEETIEKALKIIKLNELVVLHNEMIEKNKILREEEKKRRKIKRVVLKINLRIAKKKITEIERTKLLKVKREHEAHMLNCEKSINEIKKSIQQIRINKNNILKTNEFIN